MKKRGRPKLPEEDTRIPRMTIRLTKSENEEITGAITESGKPKSDWIRDALLSVARAQTTSLALSRMGETMPGI